MVSRAQDHFEGNFSYNKHGAIGSHADSISSPAVLGPVAAFGYLLNLCLGLPVLKCESDD